MALTLASGGYFDHSYGIIYQLLTAILLFQVHTIVLGPWVYGTKARCPVAVTRYR